MGQSMSYLYLQKENLMGCLNEWWWWWISKSFQIFLSCQKSCAGVDGGFSGVVRVGSWFVVDGNNKSGILQYICSHTVRCNNGKHVVYRYTWTKMSEYRLHHQNTAVIWWCRSHYVIKTFTSNDTDNLITPGQILTAMGAGSLQLRCW